MNKWSKIKKNKGLGKATREISTNLLSPELVLNNPPIKDQRITGRTKTITFSCSPEFAKELRKMAFEENCYQIEILERALEVYKRNCKI